MPNNNGDITFKYGTQEAYNGLSSIDENAIYITTDTHRIYIGGADYTDDTQMNNVTKQYVDASCASVESKIGDVVDEKIGDTAAATTEEWLTEHVNPVGSAVVVDNSLTISGAAADAKAVGDAISSVSMCTMMMGTDDVNIDTTEFTSNDICLVDGTFSQFDGWCSTPYVYCRGNSIEYKAHYYHASATDIAYLAFFDAKKQMTHCLKSSDLSDVGGTVEGTITAGTDDYYVRCVGRTNAQLGYYLKLHGRGISDDVTDLKSEVIINTSDIYAINSFIGNAGVNLLYSDYPSTQILNTNGTFTEYGGGWKSTGYVNCSEVNTLSYTATTFHAGSIDLAYLAFFDRNKQIISMLKSSDLEEQSATVTDTVQVPENAVYVMCTGKTSDCFIKINGTGMQLSAQQFNSIKATNLKMLCIGDSLTRGVINSNVDIIKESYPYWLGKMLSSEFDNAGFPGGRPDTWWARKHLYAQPTQATTLVTIMFGTNGGLETNTLDVDVEPYGDYNDYANTPVGCYCKIIEWVMAQTSNNAQIVLITPPMNWSTRSETIAQTKFNIVKNSIPTIYAIAERYGVPVINAFYESGINKFNATTFLPDDGIHLSAKGYHKLGSFLARKIASMYSEFSQSDTGTVI